MEFLLDTPILLWAASEPEKLSAEAKQRLLNRDNELFYSAASIWEIMIKKNLGRADFKVDPRLLRRGLQDQGYKELPITGDHALALETLPKIHKDPFDRLLVAQALSEGITLMTADPLVGKYPGPILLV